MVKKLKFSKKVAAVFLSINMFVSMSSYSINALEGSINTYKKQSYDNKKVFDTKEMKILCSNKKVNDELTFVFKSKGNEEYGLENPKDQFEVKTVNGLLPSFKLLDNGYDESYVYEVSLKENNKYTMKPINIFSFLNGQFPIQADGNQLELAEFTVEKKQTEDSQGENDQEVSPPIAETKAYKARRYLSVKEGNSDISDEAKLRFELIDENSNVIDSKDFASGDEVGFSFIENKKYTIKLVENPLYEMEELKLTFKKTGQYNDEFPELVLEDGGIVREIKVKRKTGGANIKIASINVVDEKGKSIKNGIEFEVYNMNDKDDIKTYKVVDGKLSGILLKKGIRYKIGPKNLEKYTMSESNDLVEILNYKNIYENGEDKPAVETDLEGIERKGNIQKLILVENGNLIGEKPKEDNYIDINLGVKDIRKNDLLLKDKIEFEIIGAGEKKLVSSTEGRLKNKLHKNQVYYIRLIPSVYHNYKMKTIKIKIDSNGKVINLHDGKELSNISLFQGTYIMRLYVLDEGFVVKPGYKFDIIGDDNSIQTVENTLGWLTFRAKRDVKYIVKIHENNTYNLKEIHFKIRKYKDSYYALLENEKEGKDILLTDISLYRKPGIPNPNKGMERIFDPNAVYEDEEGSGCGCGPCKLSNEKIKTPEINVFLNKDNKMLAVNRSIKFKLFNSTRQKYEGEYTAKNGKLQEMDVTKGEIYILYSVDPELYMYNIYFEIKIDGKKPYNFKTKESVSSIILEERRKNNPVDNRVAVEFPIKIDGKILKESLDFEFISAFDKVKATSKEGKINVRLNEDETYLIKVKNKDYDIFKFPLVIKDKSEYGLHKYAYNHSTCEQVQELNLVKKGMVEELKSIVCPSGKTEIKGFKFNNLNLLVETLNKSDFEELKNKDVDIFQMNLMNPFRCEVSKLAIGDYNITRNLQNEKEIKDVYHIKDEGHVEKLKFKRQGNKVVISTNSISVYPIVVEYKKETEKKEKILRIAGKDRIDTSVAVSNRYYSKAENIIIVRQDTYSDALAASSLAKNMNAPIILSDSKNLDSRLINEIKRLQAKKIIIIGGLESIGKNAEDQLRKYSNNGIERISGKDRYETSVKIAQRLLNLNGKFNGAVISSGENWADALSSGALAAKEDIPVLLVRKNNIDTGVKNFIKNNKIKNVYIIGGFKSVSKNIESYLPKNIIRISGKDRYETSLKLAQLKFANSDNIYLASGEVFADALSIGPIAGGRENSPILLTGSKSINEDISTFIKEKDKNIIIIGGVQAIDKNVEDKVKK
ncbi:cell wall-binding repeat-containing protein [Peptostreptococcus equinus]|uniref:Cell wall-binding repeat-containing protein n=1 Tax=Peptostreptococcus equinus TaxID=3003601 RepID=A0ABY7JT30_9FIRM|nr:cell wall-binding repeat-containing protein [Peptostreptococcus sp. CBA3647]WAW15213.1 cell wall-binding repeat-containing protein [Peptostreptococcus sp. CBA3647]